MWIGGRRVVVDAAAAGRAVVWLTQFEREKCGFVRRLSVSTLGVPRMSKPEIENKLADEACLSTATC
jgi:hypothetical protein